MNFFKKAGLFAFCCCCFLQVNAQVDFKFGFRAGMTIANMFTNSLEYDADNNAAETFKAVPKISVGATVMMQLHERFGLTGEVLFSQKGTKYSFEANNTYLKLPSIGQTFQGHNKFISINITNNYVEVPVLFYFQPIKNRLQLDFGPSISFLVSARSLGVLKYGDLVDHRTNPSGDDIEIGLDYRYFRDDAGAVVNDATREANIDQTTISYPTSIGSYYFYQEKSGSYYNIIDAGLNFGLSLYFTEGLRVGTRAYYGLTDVSSNKYDLQQMNLDANREFILRDDFDRNFGVQVFIALQF